jgi:hypothetical protein
MKLTVEVFGRVLCLQFDTEKADREPPAQEFEYAPVDPHSVNGGHAEHAEQGSLEVQHLSGAGVYSTPEDRRKFGFGHGRQD